MANKIILKSDNAIPISTLLLLVGILFSLHLTAYAQPQSEEDIALAFSETFVSIATGGEQQLSRAPAVATVITSHDIEEMGALNLDQVLETVPGLHVSYSSNRLSPIYSIRGIHSDTNPHVLMLINGTPITQMAQGDRGYYSTLPINNIKRVEVIRGPGSAVYGADAFSGVINVITKSSSDINGTEIKGTVGSFNSIKSSLLHSNQLGDAELIFSVEYEKSKGDTNRIIEEDAQSLFDNLFSTNASHAPGSLDTRSERLDTRLNLKWNLWETSIWSWHLSDMGIGPGLAQALDPKGRGDINNWLFDISYHDRELTKYLDFEAKFSYMDINTTSEQELFPPGSILPIGTDGNLDPTSTQFVLFPDGLIGNPEVYEEHLRFDTSTFFTGIEGHRWRFSLGWFNARVHGEETKNYGPGVIDGSIPVIDGTLTNVTDSPYVFIPVKERTVYYASIQDEWNLAADWDLTAGIRYDHYSDFGDTYNPRAALVWHPSFKLTTKLLYGQAFRAPSFQELYVQNNPVIDGNPDLKPENIHTLELAMDYQHTFNLRSSLSLYSYKIEDLIEYVSAGSGVPQAQNVGEQTGRGIEYEVQWIASDSVILLANYALQKAEDTSDNSDSPNSPQQQLYARIDWKFLPNWHFNIQTNRVMNRKRAYYDTRPEIMDYTITDLQVRGADVVDNWDIAFKISNILDVDAREPSPLEVGLFVPNDYPLEGRAYYVTMKYQF